MASPSAKRIIIKTEEICRTCLCKDNKLHSIFDVFDETITLDYVITSITGLKIDKSDGFPSTICHDCKEKATVAFNFKIKSEEAHLSLQGILKNEKKEWPAPSTAAVNATGIKTENTLIYDHDDYGDSDFNFPLINATDINDIESVKTEDDIQKQGQPFCECNYCLGSAKTQDGCVQNKKKKCIKIEYDESNSTCCPLCGICYEGAENLTKHMWTYHADLMGPKKRGRPKKLLTNTAKLTNGEFNSTPVNQMECVFCKQYYKTKEELSVHLMIHNDMKVQCCILCQKKYLDRQTFEQHNCTGANKETIEKKDLNYLSEISLQDLLSSNSEVDNIAPPIICTTCSCVFFLEQDLISHNDAEHPELSQRCNLCSKVFASLRSAARHRRICKQIERKYKCDSCGMKFAYEISLNKHILRYHKGESVSVKFIDTKTKCDDRQFQCDTCNRCFYKRDLLVKHTKIHMPNEKYFQCDVCEKSFHRRDNLRSHKRVHEVERDKGSSSTLLCLYCGRSFSNSSNLIVHMRRHTGEKPYKCDFCDKGFPRSSDLQCHRRTHTGEKPCICRVCGKGFSRSNKLSRHMRVHTGQRPYKCPYCDKAFSQSNDLTLHIRRHTGDRPYICEVCGNRFIQGTALQNHRRAHGHFPPPSTDRVGIQSLAYTV